jgi:glycosyltransferase involved in cell wall biosynthesis
VEKVDVVILTKDSDDLLMACLNSVYENVPVNRLIAVDGHSSDLTLRILGEFSRVHGNVEVIDEDGTRGKARDRGMREVETEWFVFVDSDVVLCRDWFRKASRLIAPDVGAVWGVDIPSAATNRLVVGALVWMESRVFDLRGGCHDLLVRREAVPFEYYASHAYPVLQTWVYYNDIYYLDPRDGSGNAPDSWQ